MREINRREIWWCETHNAEGVQNHDGDSSNECWRAVWVDEVWDDWFANDGDDGLPLCRMEKYLLFKGQVVYRMVISNWEATAYGPGDYVTIKLEPEGDGNTEQAKTLKS